MIRNRLSELLAERKLKISRVANDIPDLSRNTINSVANNKTKMIQMNTVDLLCQYLSVSPNEFFDYKPYDIYVRANVNDNYEFNKDTLYPEVYLDKIRIEIFLNVSFSRDSSFQRGNTFELVGIPLGNQLKAPLLITPDEAQEIIEYVENSRENGYFIERDYDTNYDSLIEIFLVNGSDKEQSEKFFKMWNDLGAGFQSILKDDIQEKVNEVVSSTFKQCNIGNDKPVDFSKVSNNLLFSFRDIKDFNNNSNDNNGNDLDDLPF